MSSPLCVARFLWRNRFLLAPSPWISGHEMQEQPRESGQPACVQIMRCDGCGTVRVVWYDCFKCGYTGEKI